MAVRKRFKPAEKTAFVVNAKVEWLHASRWRPGVVIGPITTTSDGWQVIGIRNEGTTRTISDGAYVTGHAGGVRLRVVERLKRANAADAPDVAQTRGQR